jgi:hypothetical protein
MNQYSDVGNVGLQFRVGEDTSYPWANPLCFTATEPIKSFWFNCGLTGSMFCVTRDPAQPNFIEFGRIEAWSEYFVQHKYH